MLHIVTDSSTMYSVKEAQAQGFDLAPLSVTINNKTYKEYEEIRTPEFVEIIRQGYLPVSSQPSIGDVLDMYQRQPEGDILNITMADGLSGTYSSACSAKTMMEDQDRVVVWNSRTLCGPHRYMVLAAQTVVDMKGGMAVVENGKVLAKLSLPVGGIMSERPMEEIGADARAIHHAMEALGYNNFEPIMSFATISLPVSPDIKITDMGLIDVRSGKVLPLFVD